MTETDFKKTLIAYIERSEYPGKTQVLDMLRPAKIVFDKTEEYTYHKWNYYKEFIFIVAPPSVALDLKEHEDFLNRVCKDVYMADGDYEFSGINIKASIAEIEDISQEILFDDIRKQIIVEIQAAKYMIWVAMAWFTDSVLYKELLKKKAEGLSVEIVLDDNDRNRDVSFNITTAFPTYWVTIQSLYPNYMHDKFCIIDLQIVIHGTFNWTLAANYNKETISIDRNRATAEKFADEYIKLKKLSH